jgi:Cytidylate kinase-like family
VKATPRPVGRLVDEQVHRWLAQQRDGATLGAMPDLRRPIVTVSRQAGANGTELAGHFAAGLGYRLWDQELVQQIAAQTGTWDEVLSVVDERARNAVEDLLTGILMGDAVTGEGYAERLGKLIRAIARRGGAVVVGRGAQFVVEPGSALRVRVVAPLEVRIHNTAVTRHLPEGPARALVEQIDRERLAFMRHQYRRDATEVCAYDLIVNSGALDLEAATDVIVSAYRAKFRAAAPRA